MSSIQIQPVWALKSMNGLINLYDHQIIRSMFRILIFILLTGPQVFAQYEDYGSYETFSDLDKYQRDYGLIFTPSLIYTTIEESNQVGTNTVSDRSRGLLFYDIRLGYVFRGGFYFGLLYAGETQEVNSSAPTTSRESLGISFGYLRHGWSLSGTFFPYSKQTLTNTTDVSQYSEGLGFQVDAAYYFRIGNYFSVGPQLVFKSINYGQAESATTSVNANASSTHSVFTPMLSMIINLYRG